MEVENIQTRIWMIHIFRHFFTVITQLFKKVENVLSDQLVLYMELGFIFIQKSGDRVTVLESQ